MPPPPSASATRIATHWVVDALAGDEAVDFSVIKALVAASPECLAGAPEATRERVALRCLQEVASVASGDDVPATAGMLRVEATRSCEDLLLEVIGEVGSLGTLDKDMLPCFSQDIQNIICMKKPTLPETSFELLKEVDSEIASILPSSQLEQNATNQHDNDQSLCSRQDHVNGEFQQETSAKLIDETESRNLEKDPVTPTSFHQPCTSDSMSYAHLQEDDAGAVGLGPGPPEKSPAMDANVTHGTMHTSAACDVTLQGSTSEPLLKDTEIHAAMVQPQSPREQSPNSPPHYIDGERLHDDGARDQSLKPSHEGLGTHAAVAPTIDRSSDALPTNVSDPGHLPESVTPEDATMVSQAHSSRTDTNVLQHESGEKVNQVLDDVSASIQPVEKDHVLEGFTPQAASALPSVSCNDAIQGGQSETNHLSGNATKHTTVLEKQNIDKSHIKFSGADKVNEALHYGASIVEKNTVHGGLNVQAAPLPQNCNLVLHDKISEVNCSDEQNTRKSRTDAQKNSCSTSVPNVTQDGTGTNTTNTSNNTNLGDTSAGIPHGSSSTDSLHGIAAAGLLSMANKMPFWSNGQEINESFEGLSQQDLCIKCGKAGQLIKCSGCLLAAHDSCFGSSVTFQESDLFYCPVCFYTRAAEAYQKARKTYFEARKNLATFLGTAQVVGQHHELLTGVLPRAPSREGQCNVSDSSKRKNIHQDEATNLAHRDEEPDQQRKKQKISATDNGSPEELVTEKASLVQNFDKHSALKGNGSNQVQDVEQQQQGKNKEADNGNSSHETRHLSQNRCGPANQELDADKEDGQTKSHQSNDSDEIEATSSNNSGKRSSPPWRKMRHRKSRLLEKETVVSSNSRKTMVQHDERTSSPSRKRNYAPCKRYSNPVAPTGRRSKLSWTEEEETTLKEAMDKFAPRDDGPIPWVQILEYGRDVFHRTRLPSDLRVKWRNIMKKAGS
ncbi:hypothetical protein PR202_ga28117 [Eleusine coracana subsp. coracana]|uniref:Myb-like domain-containing protein n=1 Tax=Eleusine coracana subsp. coracana TaxID=191504 RepID=A0AAV5DIF8_ELECO|nr:hypothetical protein QOZ80_7AG0558630 [Eleusine coracana subsp. coracana]GJN10058.1 hypothetical protein PR202_ga28117 [Eleusine coracana subsp. coracana]